jgi:RND superfamily putative drug exporter
MAVFACHDRAGADPTPARANAGVDAPVAAAIIPTFSPVLARLTERIMRRPWIVVGVCFGTALIAGLLGRGLFSRLGYSVFYDPTAESTRAAVLSRAEFGEGDPDVVALYRLGEGTGPADGVKNPEVRAAIDDALSRVAHDPIVGRVVGPTGPAGDRLVSGDRRSAFAIVSLRGTPSEKAKALPRLRTELRAVGPTSTIRPLLGGLVPAGRSLTRLAEQSLKRGERIALPVTAILLVIIFGSVAAALVPIVIGGLSIVLALGILEVLSHAIVVDAFSVNVVTILGLGVAIDYALFIISRYREELGEQTPDAATRRRALERAAETAGRAVLFSGITVAASLAGLFAFHQPFLRSVAVGGMAVVLLAAALALVVLPAMLYLLGPRIELGRVRRRASTAEQCQHRWWRRLAARVIQRPLLVCIGVTVFLLILGLPFRRLQPSRADVRSLPMSEEPRKVSELLTRDFPSLSLTPHTLVVQFGGEATDHLDELWDYTDRVRRLPNVARVDSVLSFAGVHNRDEAEDFGPVLAQHQSPSSSTQPGVSSIVHGRYTLVRVTSTVPPDSPLAQEQVDALRALSPPPGGDVLVYGQAAALRDFALGLRTRAPDMLGIICVVMFVILFIAFRSVVLPIKAMIMTALSLTASFGAIVFIFQDGRLQHLLHYEPRGTLDATLPVVMFAVVFGLSMDYEVLILGRIREAWLRTGDNRSAIIDGVAQTGRLVTSAALLMVTVFSAFAAAPVLYVKALGLGMALAVLLDATVVRMLLVPSTMALLGRLNWWTPTWPPPRRRARDYAGASGSVK